jgi:hypothetical protein
MRRMFAESDTLSLCKPAHLLSGADQVAEWVPGVAIAPKWMLSEMAARVDKITEAITAELIRRDEDGDIEDDGPAPASMARATRPVSWSR